MPMEVSSRRRSPGSRRSGNCWASPSTLASCCSHASREKEIRMHVQERSETLEALEKLAGIAALGGINMGVNPAMRQLEGEFALPDGRSQLCFVRLSARLQGKIVVTFFSSCLTVKKGFLSGIS